MRGIVILILCLGHLSILFGQERVTEITSKLSSVNTFIDQYLDETYIINVTALGEIHVLQVNDDGTTSDYRSKDFKFRSISSRVYSNAGLIVMLQDCEWVIYDYIEGLITYITLPEDLNPNFTIFPEHMNNNAIFAEVGLNNGGPKFWICMHKDGSIERLSTLGRLYHFNEEYSVFYLDGVYSIYNLNTRDIHDFSLNVSNNKSSILVYNKLYYADFTGALSFIDLSMDNPVEVKLPLPLIFDPLSAVLINDELVICGFENGDLVTFILNPQTAKVILQFRFHVSNRQSGRAKVFYDKRTFIFSDIFGRTYIYDIEKNERRALVESGGVTNLNLLDNGILTFNNATGLGYYDYKTDKTKNAKCIDSNISDNLVYSHNEYVLASFGDGMSGTEIGLLNTLSDSCNLIPDMIKHDYGAIGFGSKIHVTNSNAYFTYLGKIYHLVGTDYNQIEINGQSAFRFFNDGIHLYFFVQKGSLEELYRLNGTKPEKVLEIHQSFQISNYLVTEKGVLLGDFGLDLLYYNFQTKDFEYLGIENSISSFDQGIYNFGNGLFQYQGALFTIMDDGQLIVHNDFICNNCTSGIIKDQHYIINNDNQQSIYTYDNPVISLSELTVFPNEEGYIINTSVSSDQILINVISDGNTILYSLKDEAISVVSKNNGSHSILYENENYLVYRLSTEELLFDKNRHKWTEVASLPRFVMDIYESDDKVLVLGRDNTNGKLLFTVIEYDLSFSDHNILYQFTAPIIIGQSQHFFPLGDTVLLAAGNKLYAIEDDIVRRLNNVILYHSFTSLTKFESNYYYIGFEDDYGYQVYTFDEDNPVAIDPILSKDPLIKVYPNPSRDYIQVIIGDINDLTIPYQIYHSTGQIVNQGILNDSRRVNISNLPQGVYSIVLNMNSSDTPIQFIKI